MPIPTPAARPPVDELDQLRAIVAACLTLLDQPGAIPRDLLEAALRPAQTRVPA